MANVTLAYDADLARGVIREALRPVFATGDKNGHTFEISVKRDGAAVPLTGASVSAYFIRADRSTVPISGSVSGNKASVTLLAACYNVPGRFSLVIRLAMDGDIATIFAGDGSMLQSATDTIVDPENVVPSLSDLLAQVAAMEKATAAANTAASNADTKASAANKAASAANTAASNADTKASSGGGAEDRRHDRHGNDAGGERRADRDRDGAGRTQGARVCAAAGENWRDRPAGAEGRNGQRRESEHQRKAC